MKHKVLIRITAGLIATLCVLAEAACSPQSGVSQTAEATAQAVTRNLQPAASQSPNTADSTGSQNPPGDQESGSQEVTGTGLYNLGGGEVTKTGETLSATADDQSAVIVTGSSVLSLSDMKISSSGNTSSMDSSSFYGLNAAVLAKTGSLIDLTDSSVNTAGTGANGVFAYGENAKIALTNVSIDCTASGAHGVDAAQGGALTLANVNITAAGGGAAAGIATDRGGGTISVNGGTVLTAGEKSPAIYSTGSITAKGTVMKATGSEAVVIEGNNSAALTDCTLEAGKNYGVFIYQSMSGDADAGKGIFTMTGGSLTAAQGPLFYSTNTTAEINLNNVKLGGTGVLLRAGANQWGSAGANGAQVTLNAESQKLSGDVILDSISSADISLKDGSSLAGAINTAEKAKSVTLSLDKDSTWKVTADSHLTVLTDADISLANITGNGHTVYYDSKNNANAWLGGKTVALAGGGSLKPMR